MTHAQKINATQSLSPETVALSRIEGPLAYAERVIQGAHEPEKENPATKDAVGRIRAARLTIAGGCITTALCHIHAAAGDDNIVNKAPFDQAQTRAENLRRNLAALRH